MTPIRPNVPPPLPTTQAPRLSGESALFALARNMAAARAAQTLPAQSVATAAPPQAASARPAVATEPPQKILRPGSLIDIRV